MEEKPRRRVRKKNKKLWLAIKILLGVFFALVIFSCAFIGVTLSSFVDLSDSVNFENLKMNYTSVIYHKDPKTGEDVVLSDLYGNENRKWIASADINNYTKHAAIAIEDERFYSHNGVDFKSSIFATFKYVFQGSTTRGASTITQQLVKNITGENEKSAIRKIQEMIRAINLETKFSKDEILELYLNTIYLGEGCNGIGSASHLYFDKEPKDLTLAESASIIGITQYPSYYDPLINPENNKEKRITVLKKMLELGYINQSEYDEACNEELVFVGRKESDNYTTYFEDELVRQLIEDLQKEKDLTEAEASQLVYGGGLKIYSTIDVDIQNVLEDFYKDEKNFPQVAEMPQSSMTIIDVHNGEVKAIVGGMGEKKGSRVLNRASQLPRQPGSTIKPIAVYGPAIDKEIITPRTVYTDKKITIGKWSPKNADNRFRGRVTVKQAITSSLNTIAVQIMQDLTVDTSYEYLEALCIDTLCEDDRNFASLSLGGMTNGITNLRLTAAYATFANKGEYNEPTCYTVVKDLRGNIIIDKRNKSKRVFSEETAETMTDLMTNVVLHGTGRGAGLADYETAGKTGTTDLDYDRWFVGYTPYYVAGVWFGYDNQQSLSAFGSNPAIPVWNKVMQKVHEIKELEPKKFERTKPRDNSSPYSYSGSSNSGSTDNTTEQSTTSEETEGLTESNSETEMGTEESDGGLNTESHPATTQQTQPVENNSAGNSAPTE